MMTVVLKQRYSWSRGFRANHKTQSTKFKQISNRVETVSLYLIIEIYL